MIVPGGVDRSGTERVIPILLALVERIASEHELHVFALHQEPRPATWRLRGATVHNAGAPRARLRALRDVVAEHRRAPFDVLHGVWADAGIVAGAAGRLLRRPALVHLVGGDLAAVPEIGYGLMATRSGRARLATSVALATRVTADSAYTRRLAFARGIDAEQVTYGVSSADWPPLPPRRRTSDEARLLYVASLNRVKDPWTLLRAAAALRRRGVAFRLDAIGVDTLGGAVQRHARELGVDDVVRFHGFRTQAELRPWMERADLLLVTSLHECGPIVAMEAALCGVPTVGTRVGHLEAWSPDAAVTVAPGDHYGLADAVVSLLADEERRMRMAAAAQRRALEHGADHAAARVHEIYRELAGRTVRA